VSYDKFSLDVLRILAVPEFCALDTAEQRSAWAKSHGVPGPLSEALVRRARAACERREDNKRLGLPDPIRPKKEKP
jgi:hypothetical protein